MADRGQAKEQSPEAAASVANNGHLLQPPGDTSDAEPSEQALKEQKILETLPSEIPVECKGTPGVYYLRTRQIKC